MSEAIDQWTAGMIAFRKELKQPSKDKQNPFFKSDYVTLEGTMKSADEALETIGDKNGMTFTQEVTSDTATNTVSVTTLVSHVSGQWVMFGPLCMPAGKKNDAQSYGSSVTYAKRYALSAALGISSDIDDDGNKASGNNSHNSSTNYQSHKQQSPKFISSSETSVLEDMVTQLSDETNTDRVKLLKNIFETCHINDFKNITAAQRDNIKKRIDFLSERYKQKQIDKQEKTINKKQPITA